MKTLGICDGKRIRAIAAEADDGGPDPCPTLKFFQEQREQWGSEMTKLTALLTYSSENACRMIKLSLENCRGRSNYMNLKAVHKAYGLSVFGIRS